MDTKASLWVAVALVGSVLAGGCQQDPYRIRAVADGAAAGDGWPDASPIPDSGRRDGPGPDSLDALPPADLSYDACITRVEVCNGVDDNCDGKVDEGFDKQNSIKYCDDCKGCLWLYQENAYPKCVNGKCEIDGCFPGWARKPGAPVTDGCSYECTQTGVEICDGLDNDCNGKTDDGVTPPAAGVCNTQGPCKGATLQCQGKLGWQCNYGPDVELQPCTQDSECGAGYQCVNNVCPGVVILDEQKCDGKDGDCDGAADDPWSNPALSTAIGNDCDPTKPCTGDSDCGGGGSKCVNNLCSPKHGICRDQGVYACDPVNQDKTICKLTVAGQSPGTETCNGKDDDCDGAVDNNVTDEELVAVTASGTTFHIFRYEASRPDATAADAGIESTGRPCSVPGRLPWANVTRAEAKAACARAGAYLCTPTQWEAACRGKNDTSFPYGNLLDPSICNGRAYDPAVDEVLPTDQPANCVSPWGTTGIYNMSGNLKEWTATLGGTPTYEIRGGAFDTASLGTYPNAVGDGLSCSYVLPAPTDPNLQLDTIGFRCCR